MPNRERNYGDENPRGHSPDRERTSGRSPRNRDDYGRDRYQSSGIENDRDWNERPRHDEWNSSDEFTGRSRFDEDRAREQQDYFERNSGRDDSPTPYGSRNQPGYGDEERYRSEGNMFASSSGVPYGSYPDQRPHGGYGRGYEQEPGIDRSESRDRGSRRFLSSTDLASNYQGHYGQPRFGSVGASSGFGTGSATLRESYRPRAGQTTSDRDLYGDTSPERDKGFSRPSFRGVGPKGFQRSDERIREMVSETLEDHEAIDARDIEVHVESGEVTLTGTVSDRQTKRLAEDVIEFLPGVQDVTNNIKVKRGMIGRVADTIQHALSGDEGDDEPRGSSRSSTSGKGTSRSRR